MNDIIQIQASDINTAEVTARIQAQIAERKAKGLYQNNPDMFGPESLRPGKQEAALTQGAEFIALQQPVRDLLLQSKLIEAQFTSSAPLIGPLIAALRRAWNWMSTKWYVLPVLQQQSDFNLQASIIISELLQQQGLAQQQIANLQSRMAELEEAREHKT